MIARCARRSLCLVPLACLHGQQAALAQQPLLPPPSQNPMAINPAADPILALGRTAGGSQQFRDAIVEAVAHHPAMNEARASAEEALAGRRGAKQRIFPTVDATLSTYRVLAREFSNDPNNIIERSRGKSRTDAIVSISQPIIDFGATSYRIAAASARLRGADADMDSTADEIALRAIDAWYNVFGYRSLVMLGESFLQSQRELKSAVEERVRQGLSAPGDVARVESYLALAATRLAGYRRQQADAEARYAELFGAPPPRSLQRGPAPVDGNAPAPAADHTVPAVRSAEALAAAAREDARAARADTLPTLSGGIEAGRYGLFETDKDYDVRALATVRMRLFGGIDAQADQVRARAAAAQARADRIREEAERDAAIAASDVRTLTEQLRALEENYLASRQSRDVLRERFRVARGSLFDLLAAEDAYFETAAAYVRGVVELDTARYVLLSKTGRLLETLSLMPSKPGRR
jgi:outer membrane protein, adhesin transport system